MLGESPNGLVGQVVIISYFYNWAHIPVALKDKFSSYGVGLQVRF